MRRMFNLVNDCVINADNVLNKIASQPNAEIDLKKFMGNYSMDVIACCAFATKTDTHNDPNNPFITNNNKLFHSFIWRFAFFLSAPKLKKLLGIEIVDPNVSNFFKTAVNNNFFNYYWIIILTFFLKNR